MSTPLEVLQAHLADAELALNLEVAETTRLHRENLRMSLALRRIRRLAKPQERPAAERVPEIHRLACSAMLIVLAANDGGSSGAS